MYNLRNLYNVGIINPCRGLIIVETSITHPAILVEDVDSESVGIIYTCRIIITRDY